jgi:hypothetical protein
VRPFFECRHEVLEFLPGKDDGADLALNVAFGFSVEIVQVILVDFAHKDQVDDAGVLALAK